MGSVEAHPGMPLPVMLFCFGIPATSNAISSATGSDLSPAYFVPIWLLVFGACIISSSPDQSSPQQMYLGNLLKLVILRARPTVLNSADIVIHFLL